MAEGSELGRPSGFQPEYSEEAHDLCLLGATDKELAEHFGIAESTLYEWKKKHPEFSESIKSGKLPADTVIVGALFNRAKGFEYDEAQPIKVKEVTYDNGKRVKEIERIEIVMVHKVVPPDTTACIFWLKNRRPSDWRDRHEIEAGQSLLEAIVGASMNQGASQ